MLEGQGRTSAFTVAENVPCSAVDARDELTYSIHAGYDEFWSSVEVSVLWWSARPLVRAFWFYADR